MTTWKPVLIGAVGVLAVGGLVLSKETVANLTVGESPADAGPRNSPPTNIAVPPWDAGPRMTPVTHQAPKPGTRQAPKHDAGPPQPRPNPKPFRE